MPMDRSIEVEANGAKVKVAIPTGWVHENDIRETHVTKDHFEGEIRNRLATATQGRFKPEELMADETFLKTIAEKQKDKLIPLLQIQPPKDAADIVRIQKDIEDRITQQVVTPLQTTNKTLVEEIDVLRTRDLDSQSALACADLQVVPENVDLVKLYIRQRMAWSPEQKAWFVKKASGEGFELSLDSKKGGTLHMQAGELLETIHRSGEKKGWFVAAGQSGANFRGNRGSGQMTLEEFVKLPSGEQTALYTSDPKLFNEFQAKIAAKGEELLYGAKNRPLAGAPTR